MGYDLHITRARDWVDSQESPISKGEWLAYVKADPELRLCDDPYDMEGATAIWSGPSEHEDPWIAWDGGQLDSKNPDAPLRRKMYQVAQRFNAFLVGDDGELYGPDGEALPDPQGAAAPRQGFLTRLFWWLSGR